MSGNSRISRNIMDSRYSHDMAQLALAAALKTHVPTISRWEVGISRPSKIYAYRLAKLFDRPPDDFILTDEERKEFDNSNEREEDSK